jgi:hypothetical protein
LKLIDNMAFHDLVNLRELDMSGIPFSSLPEGLFKNNIKLESVDLGSAKITRISNKQFSHIKTLKVINFEDSFCASTKFLQHNSSILFTEDMLLPCSCLTSDKTRKESNFAIYFVLGMALVVFTVVFTFKLSTRFFQSRRYRRFRKSKYSFQNFVRYSIFFFQPKLLSLTQIFLFFLFSVFKRVTTEYIKTTKVHGLSYIAKNSSFWFSR